MLLNEKLEEAIERTHTLEGDARAMLAVLDRVDAWAVGLREWLVREGARLHDVLDGGRTTLESQAAAVEGGLREAAQDCGALAESAALAGERADHLADGWRDEAAAQVEGVAAAWRDVGHQAHQLDAAYNDAVAGCELLDIAVLEQVQAAGASLQDYGGAVDGLARHTLQAVIDHVRELRDAERNAMAAVEAFTDGCEEALCAAGRAVYGLGDAVVRAHNGAVRAFGDTSDDAPAGEAGVALRMIDQADERAARGLEAARQSVSALEEAVAAAGQAFDESESPTVAERAAQGLGAATEVIAAAGAVPPPACLGG
jgi:hypothetical protein